MRFTTCKGVALPRCNRPYLHNKRKEIPLPIVSPHREKQAAAPAGGSRLPCSIPLRQASGESLFRVQFQKHRKESPDKVAFLPAFAYLCQGQTSVSSLPPENHTVKMPFRKLFLLFALFALTTAYGESRLSVRHYSLEEGLSQNNIQSILQDSRGYIWLATWNGLERFDGYNFKNYKSYPTDSVRLSYNRITHIVAGYGSHIWCQIFGGHTYLFDSDTEQFLNPTVRTGRTLPRAIFPHFSLGKRGYLDCYPRRETLSRRREAVTRASCRHGTRRQGCIALRHLHHHPRCRRQRMDSLPARDPRVQPHARHAGNIPPYMRFRQHRIPGHRQRKAFFFHRRWSASVYTAPKAQIYRRTLPTERQHPMHHHTATTPSAGKRGTILLYQCPERDNVAHQPPLQSQEGTI